MDKTARTIRQLGIETDSPAKELLMAVADLCESRNSGAERASVQTIIEAMATIVNERKTRTCLEVITCMMGLNMHDHLQITLIEGFTNALRERREIPILRKKE